MIRKVSKYFSIQTGLGYGIASYIVAYYKMHLVPHSNESKAGTFTLEKLLLFGCRHILDSKHDASTLNETIAPVSKTK